MIKMIEVQINLSMNLVSDFQDTNLMNCGRLKPKIEIFDPKKVFDFVNNMFQEQCRM